MAATKKNHGTKQKAKIVPATGVGESIDFIVCKKAADKAKQDEKTVKKTMPKAGGILQVTNRLGGTTAHEQ